MKTALLGLVLALQMALLPFPNLGWATSFIYRPFPEVIQETPVIVRGKVGSSYSDWGKSADGTKRIYTYFELQIDEVLKGQAAGSSLIMRELGGEKDGVGMQVAGASHFERGEDVVVMLSPKTADGNYDIQGLMMGKLNVKRDESGKEIVDGPVLAPTEVHEHAVESGKPWTLDRMRKVIAEQAQASSSPSPLASPMAAKATPTAAPQLQPSPAAEGAASSSSPAENGSGNLTWILGGAAALILLGWGAAKTTRKKK